MNAIFLLIKTWLNLFMAEEMDITDLFSEKQILFNPDISDRWELIDSLCSLAFQNSEAENDVRETCRQAVIEREHLSSTAVGKGIAFPHARSFLISHPYIAAAFFTEGIEYPSTDGKPVQFACLFITPQKEAECGVKIMSLFSRLFCDEQIRSGILHAFSVSDIYRLIHEKHLRFEKSVSASDLMIPVPVMLRPDMLLREATQQLQKAGAHCAPVIDEAGRMIGELNLNILFIETIPPYMRELNSVPPVKGFNPMQEYFSRIERKRLDDVMARSYASVEGSSGIFEIIFLLAVNKHPVVYVCESGKVIGMIDRLTMLNKVFTV